MANEINFRERELFRLITEGNQAAFEELFLLFAPRIEPLIISLVRTDSLVKDIIQDVFLKLWLNREKLDAIDQPGNWIFRMAYNECYNVLRRRNMGNRYAGDFISDAGRLAANNPTEEMLFFTETSRLLKQAIHSLAPQKKKVYQMFESGVSARDIARALGLAEQTVKNTVLRARSDIRNFLINHGVELPFILILFILK